MSKREQVILPKEAVERQKDKILEIKDILSSLPSQKAYIETYGCQQNVSDSEIIMGMLESMGYIKADSKEDADFILFNTCAVRENAELKVYGNLGALKHHKAKKENLIIAVCGCMMQQKEVSERIKSKYKHVDLVFGTHSLYTFPELLLRVLKTHGRVIDRIETDGHIAEDFPVSRTEGPTAWVSVMYGCNNFCSYCIVPYVRGRERSRDAEAVYAEVRELAKKGYKEITLLGQNVNSYGKDLESNTDFADLLSNICRVDGIERVRFMTSHPKDISDKLIDVMASEDKICKQLHLPFQAGSNRILKAMNRGYTKEEYLAKIAKVKERIPDITLSTDIIVGFPGETKEDFEHTLDVLLKVRFDTIFSFIYSKRNGTPAAVMPDGISMEEKKENFNRMLEIQDEISYAKNKALEGKVARVLVEGRSKTDESCMSARTDGGKIVNFKATEECAGKFINVKITEAKTWSLFGEITD